MAISLLKPGPELEQSYRDYIVELGDEERYPFPLDFEHDDFPAYLQRLDDLANGINIPDSYVPSSTFWLVDGDEILGVSNLRHFLNDKIRQYGGHIGLGIRPSQRGKGLGSLLMALTIGEARKRGIGEIHIHCEKNNEASVRTITGNHGVLDSEADYGDPPVTIQRYVVAAV